MITVYLVREIDGITPQAIGVGLVFTSEEDAQAYTDSQYEAQSNDPFYPAKWWVIEEATFADIPDGITGYPALDGTIPNTPTSVTADVSGGIFTVSWTPNDPSSTETYTITATFPGGPPPVDTSGFTGTSGDIAGTAITGTSFQNIAGIPLGVPITFTVTAVNAFGSSAPSDTTDAVTLWANAGDDAVPAQPTDVTITLTTPGSPFNIYTMSWNQSYPSGAGTPTAWYVGDFNGGVNTLAGVQITDYAEVPASGTPTSGSFEFKASATNLNEVLEGGALGQIWAANAVGDSLETDPLTSL